MPAGSLRPAKPLRPTTTVPPNNSSSPNTPAYNQRNPAVATLAGGNYVIAWVSEQERSVNSVDIYARIFTPDRGSCYGRNIAQLAAQPGVCHSPALAPLNDGGFTAVWAQQDAVVVTNGWDIWGRAFSASGSPEG